MKTTFFACLITIAMTFTPQVNQEASPFQRYRQSSVNELEFRKTKFDVASIRAAMQERSLLANGFSPPHVEGETADGKLLIQVDVYSDELPSTVEARKQSMLGAAAIARAGFSYAFGTVAQIQSFDKWTRIAFFDVELPLKKSGTNKPVDPYIGFYENGELVLR